MPKGQHGCFNCGDRTTRVIQVWLRERNGTRQTTVQSVARSFCQSCAETAWLATSRHMDRWHGGYHGCLRCGRTGVVRVQVWMRGLGGQSVCSRSAALCNDCREDGWESMTRQYAPEGYRTQSYAPPTRNLASARVKARTVLSCTGSTGVPDEDGCTGPGDAVQVVARAKTP